MCHGTRVCSFDRMKNSFIRITADDFPVQGERLLVEKRSVRLGKGTSEEDVV
ncbi:hypothetical protein WH47_09017 [Habropoda laboriosa]|uniref:Uncharacterized protein n=1 Tax=Habropoda laboriosa TaxID=597456 RepID=A0A0L7QNP3_9HYME|nr:hypothetical protein WH47_09017 [Habropoda laboriosa]